MKLATGPLWFQPREPHRVKTTKNLLSVAGSVLITLLHITCMIYPALLNTHVYAHTHTYMHTQILTDICVHVHTRAPDVTIHTLTKKELGMVNQALRRQNKVDLSESLISQGYIIKSCLKQPTQY